MEHLPLALRRVFVLRVPGELKFREIAEVLGGGVPTVKNRMRYAVQNLRATVSELDDWLTGSRRALPA